MTEFATFEPDDNNDASLRQEDKSGEESKASTSRAAVHCDTAKQEVRKALLSGTNKH